MVSRGVNFCTALTVSSAQTVALTVLAPPNGARNARMLGMLRALR